MLHGWQKTDGRRVLVDALRGQTVKGQVPSHFHMRTWAGDHEQACRERSSKRDKEREWWLTEALLGSRQGRQGHEAHAHCREQSKDKGLGSN